MGHYFTLLLLSILWLPVRCILYMTRRKTDSESNLLLYVHILHMKVQIIFKFTTHKNCHLINENIVQYTGTLQYKIRRTKRREQLSGRSDGNLDSIPELIRLHQASAMSDLCRSALKFYGLYRYIKI